MPIGLQSKRVLRDVGNFIGVFVESDPKNLDGNWKTYMRIRVALDIRKPVERKMKKKESGRRVELANGSPSDHTALILEVGRRSTRSYRKFRFENC